MNINFWPSLQLIALVKTAKKILYSICFRAKKLRFFDVEFDVTKEYSDEISILVKSLSSEFKLPFLIEIQINGIVRSLNFEVQQWFCRHHFIGNKDCWYLFQNLCWYSYGIINQFETARKLIADENLMIEDRFIISCKYYFDDYAHALWTCMAVYEKKRVRSEYSEIPTLQYRIERFGSNKVFDSIQMFNETPILKYFHKNYLGIHCYFKELDTKARYQCISNGLLDKDIHHFDLYLCFSEMDVNEIKEFFSVSKKLCILNVIKSFLNFPLQYFCVDVLHLVWKYISDFHFRGMWDFILFRRIKNEWYDIDYEQFMKSLCNDVPEGQKLLFEEDEIYKLLKENISPKAVK